MAPGHYLLSEVDPDGYESILDNDEIVDVPADGSEIPNSNPRDNLLPVSLVVDLNQLMVEDDERVIILLMQPVLAGLGDTVWYDHNANGVQDANESGIENVTVNLLDSNGSVIDTMVTDAAGFYQFTNLLAGDYTVAIDPISLPPSLSQTYDLDDGTGPFSSPNAASVSLAAGDSNNDIDFGYRSLGTLGDTVWNDTNANGVQDAGETGIAGVEVTLSGPVSATTTTDANGSYEFTGLPQGNYTVSVDGTALDGLEQTHDLDDPATVTPTTANSTVVELTLAQPSRDDADFGFREPVQFGSIGDTVWNDQNGDGIQDPGEPGIDGVTVTLFDASGTEIASQVTANGGQYLFEDLPAGDYTVSVSGSPIDDLNQTYDLDDGTGPFASPNSASVSLAAGEANNRLDFGFRQLSSISGTVLEDSSGDNVGDRALQDNNGQPVTVMLELFAADASGNPVGQALSLTTANPTTGAYAFTGLLPGDYVVVQTQPSDFTSIADNDASADGDSFDTDTTVDDRIAVTIMPGEIEDDSNNFVEQRLGSISGWVNLDTDGDYYGDSGLPGVTLTLLDASGNSVATTTTNTNGSYFFNNLPAGDYTVVETQPAGYSSVKDRDVITTGIGDPDPQDSDTTVDDKVGVDLKLGEEDKGNAFVEFAAQSSIDIRKQEEGDDVRTFSVGDTVNFEIEVTNTGAVELSNVVVSDPLLPSCDRAIGQLGLAESVTYSCSMVLDSAQGFVNIASVSGQANGKTVTDSDPSEVVIEDDCKCVDGQRRMTLQVSDWNINTRNEDEIVRVREGGLGGVLLFEGQVKNNGSFTFSVNNPGTTIVVTVEGVNHVNEYVKGKFVTNCNLKVGKISGNSYITFKVIDLIDDAEGEACPAPPENLQASILPSLNR